VAIWAFAPSKPFSRVKVGRKADRAAPEICWHMFCSMAVKVSDPVLDENRRHWTHAGIAAIAEAPPGRASS
jgi:hypothetical protein